jgi:hypothetical protein
MVTLPDPGKNGDGGSDDDYDLSDDEVKILLEQIGDTLANHLLPVTLMHILIVIDGEGNNHFTYNVRPKVLPEALRAMADALDGTD